MFGTSATFGSLVNPSQNKVRYAGICRPRCEIQAANQQNLYLMEEHMCLFTGVWNDDIQWQAEQRPLFQSTDM